VLHQTTRSSIGQKGNLDRETTTDLVGLHSDRRDWHFGLWIYIPARFESRSLSTRISSASFEDHRRISIRRPQQVATPSGPLLFIWKGFPVPCMSKVLGDGSGGGLESLPKVLGMAAVAVSKVFRKSWVYQEYTTLESILKVLGDGSGDLYWYSLMLVLGFCIFHSIIFLGHQIWINTRSIDNMLQYTFSVTEKLYRKICGFEGTKS
jgi:hypothetical protein